MRTHLLIGLVLAALGSAGVGWQVHAASTSALAKGERPVLLCPLAGHPPSPR